MKRLTAKLSDGREILWFESQDGTVRDTHDRRGLSVGATSSVLRKDVTVDEWVVIASHRQGRTHLPPTDQCPLCPSTDQHQSEIPSDDYEVVVFENRFPSLSMDVPPVAPWVDNEDELFAQRPGKGRCEVVCFTPDHTSAFSRLSPARARLVIEAWVDRTAELSSYPDVEQVFPFENRGEEIGVTLNHPHGQIYGYPFVTARTSRMLNCARDHLARTGRNLFADVLAEERRAGIRVVIESRHWTAFVPAAARWPVEVHLYPNRHVPDLTALTEDERDELAYVYLDLLQRLDAMYDSPLPYIAAWFQAPVRIDRDLGYLHLQVFSVRRSATKLKFLAGSESAMGVFINDVAPEAVAARLRDLARVPVAVAPPA